MAEGARAARERLRALLASGETVVAPGCYDALSARLIELAGFSACYLSGASVSYTQLAQPDIGLLSLSEMVAAAERVASAVTLPVIADADTGFGNALNVRRTVRLYERAGVAAIQLEDQTFPKRCGHLSGKSVIPVEEMLGKLRAALDAREDAATLIVARTDARAVEGLDAAIERALRYIEAGADIIFVEAPANEEELAEIGRRVPAPLLANMVEGGRTPLLPVERLAQLGYRIVIFPGALVRLFAGLGRRFLAALAHEGTSAGWLDQMLPFEELQQLLGRDALNALEERYRGA